MTLANTPPTPDPDESAFADESVPLGTDAPAPAVLIELLKRQRKPAGCNRFRKYERHKCSVRVKIQIDGAGGKEAVVLECEVVTEDLSAGGFSFICDVCLAPGTTFRAHFGEFQSGPPLRAVVRRCANLTERMHRVGAEFVETARS